MKALAKYGKPNELGTYRLIDIHEPVCESEDVILKLRQPPFVVQT